MKCSIPFQKPPISTRRNSRAPRGFFVRFADNHGIIRQKVAHTSAQKVQFVVQFCAEFGPVHNWAFSVSAFMMEPSKGTFERMIRKENRMLKELTDKSLIRLGIHAENWEDAIRQAAAPLVETERIRESYVDDIIEGVRQYGPYIVLTKNVALPHARPEAGALHDAIGIATLDTPVYFGNEANDPVRYLFCLSATDDQKHLEGLAQLAQLLESSEFLDRLGACNDEQEVMDCIEELCQQSPQIS